MSKKLFCLALALMMLVCSTAFAATPSKTVGNVTSKPAVSAATEEEVGDGFVIEEKPEEDLNGSGDYVVETLEKALAENPDATVVELFGQEVADAIKALLPEGIDVSALTVAEAFEIHVLGWKSEKGDVKVPFHTLTAAGTVAALLGVVDMEGDTDWYALKTEYDEKNGDVVVTFPADVLDEVHTSDDLVLVFLNAEEEAAE